MPEINTSGSFKKIDSKLSNYEKQIAAEYKIALNQTREKIAAVYEKYSVNGVLTYGEMAKYGRLKKLETEMMGFFAAKNIKVVNILKNIPADLADFSYKEFAYAMDNQLGVRLSWGSIPTAAIEDVINNPLDKIARDSLATNQRKRIKTELAQGFLQGKGYAEMANGIKDVYGKTTYEAMRVARTEGQRSAVAAQRQTFNKTQELGIESTLFWDAYLDSRTRSHHITMNEKEAQEHDGTKMFYYTPTSQWVTGPMDTSLPAGDVINCRCRIREEILEIPDTIKTGYPKMTFSEWEKEAKT